MWNRGPAPLLITHGPSRRRVQGMTRGTSFRRVSQEGREGLTQRATSFRRVSPETREGVIARATPFRRASQEGREGLTQRGTSFHRGSQEGKSSRVPCDKAPSMPTLPPDGGAQRAKSLANPRAACEESTMHGRCA